MPGGADRDGLRETLARTPLFQDVSARTLAALVTRGRVRRYRAASMVHMAGDTPGEVFCLVEGRVQLLSTTTDGRRTLLAVLAPPAMFGELGVLSGTVHATTAECLEDSDIWSLSATEFLAFLDAEPASSRALMRALARQVLAHESLVEDLLFLDLKGRVAKRLLALVSKSWDELPPDGAALPWDITQTDLANLCGGSREKVSRILSDFQRRGLVKRAGRRYILCDIKALRRLARL